MKILILAGGKGVRLWPLSREEKPKQFQRLISRETMLQETVKRLLPEFSWKDIFISTNVQYQQEVKLELPKISKKNIITEPVSRERVAAVLLFFTFLNKKESQEPLLILPSDHQIKKIDVFKQAIAAGRKFIKENQDYILILGAKPTFPDTGLGYIKQGELIKQENGFDICHVDFFKEKPNLKRTREYLQEGNYLWNTAMYIFMPALIEKQIKKFVPDNYLRYEKIKRAKGKANFKDILESEYSAMDKASLEYNIIENYKKVAVLACDFSWSDIGSWAVLKDCLSEPGKNYAKGNHIDVDSKNVMVYGSSDKLVASVGVRDLIIVVTDDIILVCNKNQSQKVKQLKEQLEKNNQFYYL